MKVKTFTQGTIDNICFLKIIHLNVVRNKILSGPFDKSNHLFNYCDRNLENVESNVCFQWLKRPFCEIHVPVQPEMGLIAESGPALKQATFIELF